MTLPIELTQAVEQAFQAVQTHRYGALIPFHRKAIYDALGEAGENWIAVLAGWHILPVIKQQADPDDRSEPLLILAEGVLRGAVESAPVQEIIKQCEELLSFQIYVADPAVRKAAWLAVGSNHFLVGCVTEDIPALSDDEPDLEHWWQDDYFTDAAEQAVVTYADSAVQYELDLVRSREFWKWWLYEAVPQAWQLAQSLPALTMADRERYVSAQKNLEQALASFDDDIDEDNENVTAKIEYSNSTVEDENNFRRLLELEELIVRNEIAEPDYALCNFSECDDFAPEDLPALDPWWG